VNYKRVKKKFKEEKGKEKANFVIRSEISVSIFPAKEMKTYKYH
jgi:hypothetical protein